MSNFLDLEPEEQESPTSPPRPDLKQMLIFFYVYWDHSVLHPEVSDKLAAVHGFASREAVQPAKVVGGRRQVRGVAVEETRQLSIRMPLSLYNDFLAFADRERMTYNEAIRALLDKS